MKFYFIKAISLLLLLLTQNSVLADNNTSNIPLDETPITDEMLCEDSIYALTFTNPDLTRRILEECRNRGLFNPVDLGMMEGDFHYNLGEISSAQQNFKEALKFAVEQNDTLNSMQLYYRMAFTCDRLDMQQQYISYLDSLKTLATLTNDYLMQSFVVSAIASTVYYQESKEQGIRLMREAIELGKKSDFESYPYARIQLHEQYCMLADFLAGLKRYTESVEALEQSANLLRISKDKLSGEEEYDAVAKMHYAIGANVYQRMGNTQKADELFAAWEKVAAPSNSDYIICNYLVRKGNFKRALEFAEVYIPQMMAEGQQYSEAMEELLRCKAASLSALNRKAEACDVYVQLVQVMDSVIMHRQQAESHEYGIKYDSEISNMKYEMERTKNDVEKVKTQRLWAALIASLSFMLYLAGRSLNRSKRTQLYRKLAMSDNLTGLLSRYGGTNEVEKKLDKKTPGWLLIFDLDNFKLVNDSLGHVVGDQYLIQIAQTIKKCFPKDVCMRLGGDEMAIFLYQTGKRTQAHITEEMNHFFELIDNLEVPRIENYTISMSAGIAKADESDTESFDRLYRIADHRLYMAKKHTGSCLVWDD